MSTSLSARVLTTSDNLLYFSTALNAYLVAQATNNGSYYFKANNWVSGIKYHPWLGTSDPGSGNVGDSSCWRGDPGTDAPLTGWPSSGTILYEYINGSKQALESNLHYTVKGLQTIYSQDASVSPEGLAPQVDIKAKYGTGGYSVKAQMWGNAVTPVVTWTTAQKSGATRNVTFKHWTIDGVDQTEGVAAQAIAAAAEGHTLVAVYEYTQVSLTVKSGAGGSVSLSHDALHDRDEVGSVQSTAQSAEGYAFAGWYSGAGKNIDESACTTLVTPTATATFAYPEDTDDVTYVAKFTALGSYTLNLTVDKSGASTGTVSLKYGETVKTAASSNSFTDTCYRTKIYKLTAVNPDATLYVFLGYYDSSDVKITTGLSEDGTELSFTQDSASALAITAKFAEVPSYAITTNVISGPGCTLEVSSVMGAKGDGTYRSTDTVTVTAIPSSGYAPAQWDATGFESVLASAMENPCVYSFSPTENTEVGCTFAEVKYRLTLLVDAPSLAVSAGSVDVYDAGMASLGAEFADVSAGTSLYASAAANAGYGFEGWYDEDGAKISSTALCPITINLVNRTLTAKFSVAITLDLNSTPTGKGALALVDAEGEIVTDVPEGTNVTLTYAIGTVFYVMATTLVGGQFVGWTLDSAPVVWATGIPVAVTATTASTIAAEFSATPVYVSLRLTNGTGGGLGVLNASLGSTGIELDAEQYYYYFAEGSASVPPDIMDGLDRFFIFRKNETSTIYAALIELVEQTTPFKKWVYKTRIRTGGTWVPADSTHAGHWDNTASFGAWSAESDLSTLNTTAIVLTSDIVVRAVYYNGGPFTVTVRHGTASSEAMGAFYLSPAGSNPSSSSVHKSASYGEGVNVTLNAFSVNGYAFKGWYADAACETLLSPSAITPSYTISAISANADVYALFERDTFEIFKWEGSLSNKLMEWRSKRIASAVPFNLSAVRIDADLYPVEIRIGMSSSPDSPSSDKVVQTITNQDARRLPMFRPEKYVEIEIRSAGDVTGMVVATSMGGLAL